MERRTTTRDQVEPLEGAPLNLAILEAAGPWPLKASDPKSLAGVGSSADRSPVSIPWAPSGATGTVLTIVEQLAILSRQLADVTRQASPPLGGARCHVRGQGLGRSALSALPAPASTQTQGAGRGRRESRGERGPQRGGPGHAAAHVCMSVCGHWSCLVISSYVCVCV